MNNACTLFFTHVSTGFGDEGEQEHNFNLLNSEFISLIVGTCIWEVYLLKITHTHMHACTHARTHTHIQLKSRTQNHFQQTQIQHLHHHEPGVKRWHMKMVHQPTLYLRVPLRTVAADLMLYDSAYLVESLLGKPSRLKPGRKSSCSVASISPPLPGTSTIWKVKVTVHQTATDE